VAAGGFAPFAESAAGRRRVWTQGPSASPRSLAVNRTIRQLTGGTAKTSEVPCLQGFLAARLVRFEGPVPRPGIREHYRPGAGNQLALADGLAPLAGALRRLRIVGGIGIVLGYSDEPAKADSDYIEA
jgi:hypothetical protein